MAKTSLPTNRGFDSAQAPAQALAQSVAAKLRAALQARGSARLIASGGRTSAQFLTLLSQQELDWTKDWVRLADERCVDEVPPDSYAALVRKHLPQNYAVDSGQPCLGVDPVTAPHPRLTLTLPALLRGGASLSASPAQASGRCTRRRCNPDQ